MFIEWLWRWEDLSENTLLDVLVPTYFFINYQGINLKQRTEPAVQL